MPYPDRRGRWQIDCSTLVARKVRQLQLNAARHERGQAVNSALHRILLRLHEDPDEFGEPIYRLSSLRLQIRQAIILPLAIDFAVSEDQPHVFIKGIQDLG